MAQAQKTFSSITIESKTSDIEFSQFIALSQQNKITHDKIKELFLLNANILPEKYQDYETFLASGVRFIVNSKQNTEFCIMTDDYFVIFIDLESQIISKIHLPILKAILTCEIRFITSKQILFGGVFSYIIIDLNNPNYFEIVEFRISQPEIKSIKCSYLFEEQDKLIKKILKPNCIGYDGKYSFKKNMKIIPRAVTCILYSKNESSNSFKPILRYYVSINFLSVSNTGSLRILKQTSQLDFSTNKIENPKIPIIILKPDSNFQNALIALNSTHKLFCQILILSLQTGSAIHIQPVNFITGNDTLPTDKFGCTSMNISDLCWTPNNLFFICSFFHGYMCIFSKCGAILEFINPLGKLYHFETFECEKMLRNGIQILPKNTYEFWSETKKTVCRITNFPSELDFIELPNNMGKINSVLKLLSSNQCISIKPELLEILSSTIESEIGNFHNIKQIFENPLIHSDPNSQLDLNENFDVEIQFTNPFPTMSTPLPSEILKNALKFLDAMRYNPFYFSNILEVIISEFDNAFRLLLMCIFYIFN